MAVFLLLGNTFIIEILVRHSEIKVFLLCVLFRLVHHTKIREKT